MKVKFNEEVAFRVFAILEKMWNNKEGVFKDIILPQDRYPAPVEIKEHLNWLFYGALFMRGGVVSEDPFRLLWELRKKFPEMFCPEIVMKEWPQEKISSVIQETLLEVFSKKEISGKKEENKGYKTKEFATGWHHNSVSLCRFWGGDILNVFSGVTDFEDAFRLIQRHEKKNPHGFFGMRRKIFSLFTIWLQEKKLIPAFPTPIPIDFHALRVLWQTDILEIADAKPFFSNNGHPPQFKGKMFVKVSEKLTDSVALWSKDFLMRKGFSHLAINPALWVLSRILCSEHFQASSSKNRTVYVETYSLSDNPYVWPRKYKNPCASCPLSRDCNSVIPSAPHYLYGYLMKIGERVDYPLPLLPGIDWIKIPPRSRKSRRQTQKAPVD